MKKKHKPKQQERKPLGEIIRRLREEKGLSVTDAAELADLSPVLWLKIEAEADENTPLRTLRTVAQGLGITLKQLAAELE